MLLKPFWYSWKKCLDFTSKLKLRVMRSKTTSLHIFLTICESHMTLCETARLNVWNGIYTTYKLSRFLHSRFIMFKNIILTTQKPQTWHECNSFSCMYMYVVCGNGKTSLLTRSLMIHWNNCDWMPLQFTVLDHTFLLGECITGAGGDGGPLGIFLLVLKSRLFY